jgi:hypothetical protein
MVTRYGSETITGALAIQAASTTGSGALSAALLISTTVNAKAIGIQAATNQGADLVSVMDRGGNTLLRVGGAGALQNYGSYAWFGGLQTPTVVNVTNVGTAGTTTYGYRIAATSATGVNTVASSTASTTTGNATLDTTNYNTVTWTGIVGASSYQIYGRTAGAELFIATVPGDGRATSYTWNDQGTVVTPAGALPSATGSTTLTVQGWNSQAANLADVQGQRWQRHLQRHLDRHGADLGGQRRCRRTQAGLGAGQPERPRHRPHRLRQRHQRCRFLGPDRQQEHHRLPGTGRLGRCHRCADYLGRDRQRRDRRSRDHRADGQHPGVAGPDRRLGPGLRHRYRHHLRAHPDHSGAEGPDHPVRHAEHVHGRLRR